MIKGLIFDYGGTLDTCGNHWGKVIWHAYEHCQVPISEANYREAYVYAERTLGRSVIIRPNFTFKQTLDVKLRLQLEYLITHGCLQVAGKQEYQQLHTALHHTLYSGVRAAIDESIVVLRQLHEHYPIVLVSNFYGNVNQVLAEMKIDHLFSQVVESAVVGIRKPDPRIYQLGVEALQKQCAGIEPKDILVVGDSMNKDIIPAKFLGCQTAWYKGEGWTDKQEDESLPDFVLTNLADLLHICL